ncbi:MAG: flagellar biosynthesis protein [Paenibacillaceae bacterium]|nr:flagellar biosynthesis protein [Paenibacillaceae bacterium]
MSRIIKPQFYISLDDKKEINVTAYPLSRDIVHESVTVPPVTAEQEEELRELLAMKDRILDDAEKVAEEQVGLAFQEAAAVREQAQAEIEDWWQQRRSLDAQAKEDGRQEGLEQGYQQGLAQAEEQVLAHYEAMLAEARTLLTQAYDMKRQIIQESEPFLIELSTAIAGKIIHQELTLNPELIIGMTRSTLSRRREKGHITLCVSPSQFAFFRDSREELLLSLDSQAELQILPDSSVGEHGCVVRTEFGSVDARVDTQLKEIKQALQQLSMESGEGVEEA